MPEMNDIAISIQDLSKKYQIGAMRGRSETLPEALARTVRHPFSAFRRGSASKSNEFWALRDVSFEIGTGEVVGVVGRNGAGKSTLLKVLSQITAPTTGSVELCGRVASLLEVGTGFHPELTGRENVYLNGAILGMRRQEITRNFDDIVSFAGVEQFLDTPVKRYSSGMYVRLAFAVAAHLRPEILLVDEVLAVGDVEFQRRCVGRIESVAREGRTVVVVSHSMSTVRALCDRAVLLENGQVKTFDTAAAVVDEYLKANRVDAAEKAIGREDHTFSGGKLFVRTVRLRNAVADSFCVYWGQPLELEVVFEVIERLDRVSFGAGIRLPDGTHVFHVHHGDSGQHTFWDLDPGTYRLELCIENPMRPGVYRLHLGADHENLMMRPIFGLDAITFEVLDHDQDGQIPLASNTGMVNGASCWMRPVADVPYLTAATAGLAVVGG